MFNSTTNVLTADGAVQMRKSSGGSWVRGVGDVSANETGFTPKMWDSYQSFNILKACDGGNPFLIGTLSHSNPGTDDDQIIHVWEITSGLGVAGGSLRLRNIGFREYSTSNNYFHEGMSIKPSGTSAKVEMRVFGSDYDGNCTLDSCCEDDSAGHLNGYDYRFEE